MWFFLSLGIWQTTSNRSSTRATDEIKEFSYINGEKKILTIKKIEVIHSCI